jgi:hypothetical protein
MPRRFPAAPVADRLRRIHPQQVPAQPAALPPELEARIRSFENAAPTADFGAAGWFWMITLGVVIPLALLLAGWWV